MNGQNISKYSKEIRGFVTECIAAHRLIIIGRKLILVNRHQNRAEKLQQQSQALLEPVLLTQEGTSKIHFKKSQS